MENQPRLASHVSRCKRRKLRKWAFAVSTLSLTFHLMGGGKLWAAVLSVDLPPEASAEAIQVLARVNEKANSAAAAHLGVPLASIQACRQAGFPLFMAMIQAVVARESGMGIQDVIEARLEGYSWAEICEAWGISMETVADKVKSAYGAMMKAGVEIPSDTLAEIRRSVGTGSRQKPIKSKP